MAHTRRTQENNRETQKKYTHTQREREKITEKQKNNMQMRLCSILSGAEPKVKVKV